MEKYVIRNIERPDAKIVEAFRDIGVSTVYEAQGRIGLMDPALKPVAPGSAVCGPAVTVTCQSGDNLMIHAAIEVVRPGDVLVVTATGGDNLYGMIGELIVRSLMKRGVAGVVIDSGIRDVRQIRELGFPVWARGVHSLGTTKSRGGWVNAPVVCGGVAVDPGDLILGDDDGVVVVKRRDVQAALEASRKRVQKEEGTMEKIGRGELSLDYYNLRQVLERENVVYYDTVEDYLARRS